MGRQIFEEIKAKKFPNQLTDPRNSANPRKNKSKEKHSHAHQSKSAEEQS